jgi:5'-nucleotidase
MRILITNDDGINSPGLTALERIAQALGGDVWVVAPELDQSGLAHSLSLNDPLRLRAVSPQHYAVRGTPSDCVIMAVRHLLPATPDLLLSGVNSGTNIADDITYSGTIAGAIEGTLLGIPSIALSQGYEYTAGERVVPWATAEALAPAIIAKLIAFGFPPGVFYNLNFPNVAPDKIKGTAITAQGELSHALHVEERRDGRNLPYYWLVYRRKPANHAPGSDDEAIAANMVSVTPLRLDMTARDLADPLRHHFSRETG